mgnify:CR=1 FL=1
MNIIDETRDIPPHIFMTNVLKLQIWNLKMLIKGDVIPVYVHLKIVSKRKQVTKLLRKLSIIKPKFDTI